MTSSDGSRATQAVNAFAGFLGLAGSTAIIIGIFRASTVVDENDARWWFLGGGLCLVAALFLLVAYYLLHPMLAGWDARRKSRLAQVRATRTDLRPSPAALPSGRVTVHTARYGTNAPGGNWADVTLHVRGHLDPEGHLDFRATNGNLGGDPSPNLVKRLELVYSIDDEEQVSRGYSESERVTLPELSGEA